jgi:hypothetical protein
MEETVSLQVVIFLLIKNFKNRSYVSEPNFWLSGNHGYEEALNPPW